ncbi:dihydroxyacetone kinase family protein [Leucobacter weissii]|uniref:Dihydroxyacetone kinase family protein n=1 Tax=Leucobacter weissii TaxID=1983706 RepID=A0A939MLK9_9MICO|nr:dihydroxyacetone kinase family protein [Leucobacter weissii]MBO1903243.1 dihydroxyacetone kinase family protein [Leucobacter weissii]
MTRLFNDPADFTDQMIDGLVAAHPERLVRVSGGVARRSLDEEAHVSVVIGGGSGHYPAFAGLVGPGLADAAVMGNIFASPSINQVFSVAKSVDQGRGILLSYGNYAGDVLNFSEAQERLRAEGIDCRTVAVADDIFSAPADALDQRRGIAGDLTVFKVAGAAAAAGSDLDEVERLAVKTNARTRSMGVAFSGCTLPGADAPLFSVPEGMMAIGLGIHGEPGLDTVPMPTADALAELFVERLLAEVPDGLDPRGVRVVPILNGLGSVKYEELFVVFGRVSALLTEAGLELVDPQVGEFCTSFDMAGASLTLLWLDDELERHWLAPADSPAFRRGAVSPSATRVRQAVEADSASVQIPEASSASRVNATRVIAALDAVADALAENAESLGALDSVAGDGDHGIGMKRGSAAAARAARGAQEGGAGAGTTLTTAAEAWSDAAGGTSGALWRVILASLGEAVGDFDPVGPRVLADGFLAARQAVAAAGGAEIGDKTLVDALVPFVETFDREVRTGASSAAAWRAAAEAASAAADATADLLPRKGRARSHGEHAMGSPDPGAISLAMIAEVTRPPVRIAG